MEKKKRSRRLSMKLLLKIMADFMHKNPKQDMKPIVDFIELVEEQMKPLKP